MATAGYSGTPLIQKLGIKPAMKILDFILPKIIFNCCNQTYPNNLLHQMKTPILFIFLQKRIRYSGQK